MSRQKGIKSSKTRHKWTDEEKEYLALIVKGRTSEDITRLINEKFKINLDVSQVRGAMNRYKFKSGIDCNFKKGLIPWNKGTKGLIKACETSFKKGHIPANYRPVGSERTDSDGYVYIKTKDPNIWELKSRVIYKKNYGEIPPGHVVIFANGIKDDFRKENLLLVSRKQLLVLNDNNLIKGDAELTKTGINIADILIKLGEVKKQ